VAFVFLGGVALVAGFVLALAFPRTLVLLGVGAALVAVWLLVIYFSARPTSESPDCSDCGAHLGRWLDAAAILVVVGGNALGWLIGVLAGSAARHVRRRHV
jgi:hypothetical protein